MEGKCYDCINFLHSLTENYCVLDGEDRTANDTCGFFENIEIDHSYDTLRPSKIDKDAKAREVRENIIERDYEILKALGEDDDE